MSQDVIIGVEVNLKAATDAIATAIAEATKLDTKLSNIDVKAQALGFFGGGGGGGGGNTSTNHGSFDVTNLNNAISRLSTVLDSFVAHFRTMSSAKTGSFNGMTPSTGELKKQEVVMQQQYSTVPAPTRNQEKVYTSPGKEPYLNSTNQPLYNRQGKVITQSQVELEDYTRSNSETFSSRKTSRVPSTTDDETFSAYGKDPYLDHRGNAIYSQVGGDLITNGSVEKEIYRQENPIGTNQLDQASKTKAAAVVTQAKANYQERIIQEKAERQSDKEYQAAKKEYYKDVEERFKAKETESKTNATAIVTQAKVNYQERIIQEKADKQFNKDYQAARSVFYGQLANNRTAMEKQSNFDTANTGKSSSLIGLSSKYVNPDIYNKRAGLGDYEKDEPSSVATSVLRRAVVYGAVTTAIYGAVGAAKSFIGTMIQIDTAVGQLKKNLSGTNEDFKSLINNAVNIAKTYKGSVSEVLQSMQIFSQTFKRPEEVTTLAKSSTILSNISGETPEESAKTLISAIDNYNLTVSDAAKITDSWAAVSANGATTTKDLADAMQGSGAAAKQAGLSLDQLNGIVAAISQSTGKSGKDISSSLNRIFEMPTTPAGIKALSQLGVYVNDAKGQLRPFGDILGDVNKKWEGLSSTAQKNIAVAFGGQRQYQVFLALMQNYGKALEETTISQNSLGAAQKQNDAVTDTLAGKWKLFNDEVAGLAVEAGQTTIPALKGILDVANLLIGAFTKLSPLMQGALAIGAAVPLGNMAISGASKLLGYEKINPLTSIGTAATSAAINSSEVGYGPAFGATGVGAMAGASEAAVGIGAFATGLIVVIAALAALAAISYSLYKVWDFLRDKSSDIIKEQQENQAKDSQKISSLDNFSMQLKDAAKTREGLSGKEKSDFDKNTLTGLIKTIQLSNPNISSKLSFDQAGNIINMSQDRLRAFAESLAQAAIKVDELGKASGVAAAYNATDQILIHNKDKGNFLKLGDQTDGSDGGRFAPGTGINRWKYIDNLNKQAVKAQVVLSNDMSSDDITNLESRPGVGKLPKDKSVIEQAIELAEEKQSLQQLFNGDLASYSNLHGYKAADDYRKNTINAKIDSKYKDYPGLAQNLYVDMPDFLNKDKSSIGVPYNPENEKGVRLSGRVPRQFGRIDLELQKSLIDSSTNYGNLGASDVDVASEAAAAYRKAIVEMGTDTKKAAGPEEQEAFLQREKDINDQKDKLSTLRKPVKDESAKELETRKKNVDELIAQLYTEQDIQDSIQGQNDEREKGLKLLEDQYDQISDIADMEKVLKSSLSSTLSSIPKTQQERIAGNAQDNVDMNYEVGTAGQIKNKTNPYALQLQFTPYDPKVIQEYNNYEVQRRNNLKNINEEMAKMNRAQDELNQKTNIWNQLLSKIGGGMVDTIAKNLTDMAIGGLATDATNNITGDTKKKGLLGETNSVFNSLLGTKNSNTPGITPSNPMHVDISSIGGTQVMPGQGFGGISTGGLGTNSNGGFDSGAAALLGTGGAIAGLAAGLSKGTANNNMAAGLGLGLGGTTGTSSLTNITDINGGMSALSSSIASLGENSSLVAPNASSVGTPGTSATPGDGGQPTSGPGASNYLMGAFAGAGVGSTADSAQNKTGNGAVIGGVIGGIAGTYYGSPEIGALLGGIIGSMFDKNIPPLTKALNEQTNDTQQLTYNLQTLTKSLNTVNQTMENLINAPSSFSLPIPGGILSNSVTAASAIATPMQAGGIIRRSGAAYLHTGEVVTNGGLSSNRPTSVTNTIHINGSNSDPQEIANAVATAVTKSVANMSQRQGNYTSKM